MRLLITLSKPFAGYNISAKRFLRFETSYHKEVLAYRISYRKDVLAVATSNRKEVLEAWRIQAQATCKKPQEVVGLRTQKEVLARALFLGCTLCLSTYAYICG